MHFTYFGDRIFKLISKTLTFKFALYFGPIYWALPIFKIRNIYSVTKHLGDILFPKIELMIFKTLMNCS